MNKEQGISNIEVQTSSQCPSFWAMRVDDHHSTFLVPCSTFI